jgi:ribonuclease HI
MLSADMPFLPPDEWLTRAKLNQQVSIYLEGVCKSPIKGPGAWCALFRQNNLTCYKTGSSESATENRMEMIGASEGLSFLPERSQVRVFTTSKFLHDGIVT